MAEKKKKEIKKKTTKTDAKTPKRQNAKTPKKKEIKKKMGRPKIQIDYDLVLKLSSMMCTEEEIATFFNCSTKTLQRDEEFCRIFKKGQENGKMSLRRIQWKHAEKNASMAMFLGKVYLNQKEHEEEEKAPREMPEMEIKVIDNSNLEKALYEANK